MPTTFRTPINNVSTTLGSAHSIASGTLVVASGAGSLFGTVFPLRVTVITAASYGTTSEVLTIFNVTARTTDTLTVSGAIEGTTDQVFAIGARVEIRPTAATFSDIHTAVNTLENTTALDSAVVHNSGNETVAGIKTFSTSPVLGSLTGLIKGASGSLSAAVAGTDFLAPTGGTTVTTLGTVTTGTWNATTIATNRGGTGLTAIGTALQVLRVNAGATGLEFATITASVGIGGAVSGGAANAVLYQDGSQNLAASSNLTYASSTLTATRSTGGDLLLLRNTTTTATVRLETLDTVGKSAGVTFFVNGTQGWSFSTTSVSAAATGDFGLYNQTNSRWSMFIRGDTDRVGLSNITAPGGMLHVQPLTTTTHALVLQAIASQGSTTYLLNLQNSAGTSVGNIDAASNTWLSGTVGLAAASFTPGGLFHARAASGQIAGVFQRNASGSADILQIYNESGTSLAKIDYSGFLTAGGAFFGATRVGNLVLIGNNNGTAAAGPLNICSSNGSMTSNTAGSLVTFLNNDIWQQSANQSANVYRGVTFQGVFQASTAITFSSTARIISTSIEPTLGNTSLTYNSTIPLTAFAVAPTFNIATASTGRACALFVDPTFTSVGTGVINYLAQLRSGGTDRFIVTASGHVVGNATASSIAGGTGAGTSPTVSVSGNDQAGVITVTTGTTPSGSAATVATITLGATAPNAPKSILLSPANANAAALSGTTQVWADTPTATTTAWTIKSGSAALAASTTYLWSYQVDF